MHQNVKALSQWLCVNSDSYSEKEYMTASVLVLSDHSTWSHLRPEWCICLVTLFSKFHSLIVVFQFKVSSRLMTFNWTLELRFRTVFGMKPKCKVEVLDGSLVVLALKDFNSEVFPFLSYGLKTKTMSRVFCVSSNKTVRCFLCWI